MTIQLDSEHQVHEIVVDPTLLCDPEFFNSNKQIKNTKSYAVDMPKFL